MNFIQFLVKCEKGVSDTLDGKNSIFYERLHTSNNSRNDFENAIAGKKTNKLG